MKTVNDRLYRAQILLEPGQHAQLREIAEREGRSISEVARALLALGLRQALLERQRAAKVLDQMGALRQQIAEEQSIYRTDPVAESRADRDADLDLTMGLGEPAPKP